MIEINLYEAQVNPNKSEAQVVLSKAKDTLMKFK